MGRKVYRMSLFAQKNTLLSDFGTPHRFHFGTICPTIVRCIKELAIGTKGEPLVLMHLCCCAALLLRQYPCAPFKLQKMNLVLCEFSSWAPLVFQTSSFQVLIFALHTQLCSHCPSLLRASKRVRSSNVQKRRIKNERRRHKKPRPKIGSRPFKGVPMLLKPTKGALNNTPLRVVFPLFSLLSRYLFPINWGKNTVLIGNALRKYT